MIDPLGPDILFWFIRRLSRPINRMVLSEPAFHTGDARWTIPYITTRRHQDAFVDSFKSKIFPCRLFTLSRIFRS